MDFGQVNLKGEWKEESGQYVTSTSLFIGKIRIARYFYNGMRPKGSEYEFKATSCIDQIKSFKETKTRDEAEAFCMQVALAYVKGLSNA